MSWIGAGVETLVRVMYRSLPLIEATARLIPVSWTIVFMIFGLVNGSASLMDSSVDLMSTAF